MEKQNGVSDGAAMRIARHMVSALFFMAIAALFTPGPDYAVKLLGMAAFVFGVAAFLAGLAWLFVTKREAGRTSASFAIATWVMLALVLLGSFR